MSLFHHKVKLLQKSNWLAELVKIVLFLFGRLFRLFYILECIMHICSNSINVFFVKITGGGVFLFCCVEDDDD